MFASRSKVTRPGIPTWSIEYTAGSDSKKRTGSGVSRAAEINPLAVRQTASICEGKREIAEGKLRGERCTRIEEEGERKARSRA